jgi:hypothetical protein
MIVAKKLSNMHIYVYDEYLNNAKYHKQLASIETRITDLGLSGKIVKLGIMKNVHDMVINEIRRGAKTIVAVGNDHTVQSILTALVGTEVPLGIIPLDGENQIAAKLGINDADEACDILSARRIEHLDMGKVNDVYFLSHISIAGQGTTIEIENKYTIESDSDSEIYVINLDIKNIFSNHGFKSNPHDNMLELAIMQKVRRGLMFSHNTVGGFFAFPRMKITNKKYPLMIGDTFSIKTPVMVIAVPAAIKVIVGKGREF